MVVVGVVVVVIVAAVQVTSLSGVLLTLLCCGLIYFRVSAASLPGQ